jgi:hypothetical protein
MMPGIVRRAVAQAMSPRAPLQGIVAAALGAAKATAKGA